MKNAIAIGTSAREGGPVRVDWRHLNDEETVELAALTDGCASGLAFDLSKLSRKDRTRWEGLVETAGSLGAGYFERDRETAKLQNEFRQLAREAQKPHQPTVKEQERLLRLLHAHVRDGVLHLDRLAILIYVVGQILAAEPLAPRSRLEGAGDTLTLVLRTDLGLGANHDPYGQIAGKWPTAIEQLSRNEYLVSERAGDEMRVRLGARTLRALGRPT